jgi:hypothetical protein
MYEYYASEAVQKKDCFACYRFPDVEIIFFKEVRSRIAE